MDCGGKDDKNARTLKDIANMHNENIYIKSDGSIDDGFEIVSHSMTLEYHLNEMDWESVMQNCSNVTVYRGGVGYCGLIGSLGCSAFFRIGAFGRFLNR